jgi:hypothetical protein
MATPTKNSPAIELAEAQAEEVIKLQAADPDRLLGGRAPLAVCRVA